MKFKDFTGTTQTINNHPTRNVKWNNAAQLYLGQVYDENHDLPEKWRSCVWSKSGKNKTRPEFNLA